METKNIMIVGVGGQGSLLASKLLGKLLLNEGYDYARFLPRGKPNAVVLGCTHYIYIKNKIEKHYNCEAFDGNEGIAKRLCFLLRQKNRDGRPPFQKKPKILGFLTTKKLPKRGGVGKGIKTNKSSLKNAKNRPENGGAPTLFFLGKQRENNENTYEQMFAPQKGSKIPKKIRKN